MRVEIGDYQLYQAIVDGKEEDLKNEFIRKSTHYAESIIEDQRVIYDHIKKENLLYFEDYIRENKSLILKLMLKSALPQYVHDEHIRDYILENLKDDNTSLSYSKIVFNKHPRIEYWVYYHGMIDLERSYMGPKKVKFGINWRYGDKFKADILEDEEGVLIMFSGFNSQELPYFIRACENALLR